MNRLHESAVNAIGVAGRLTVSVRSATNLPDNHGHGKGPYCILKCGKNVQRTEAPMKVPNSAALKSLISEPFVLFSPSQELVNPVWRETFTYMMKVANVPKILFRLRVVTGLPSYQAVIQQHQHDHQATALIPLLVDFSRL